MKNLLVNLFKKLSTFLGDSFFNSIKWLNDELFNWLPKFLKGLGFTGLAGIIIKTFSESFDSTVDKFGFFATLFQIDDVFTSINNSFGSSLHNTLNTDFIGLCNAFGIIASINEIINCLSWTLIIWVFIFIVNNLFKFIAGALLVVPK